MWPGRMSGREGGREGEGNRVQIGSRHGQRGPPHTDTDSGDKNVPTSSWVWQTRWTFSLVSSLCVCEGGRG